MATIIDAIIRLKDSLTPSLNTAQKSLQDFSNKSKNATAGLKQLHNGMTTINTIAKPMALGIIGAGVACMKTFKDIDTEYHNLQANLGSSATPEGLLKLKQQAIELSNQYNRTQEDVLKLQACLATAGEDQEHIAQMTKPIIEASIASGMEAEELGSMLTDVMASMGIGAEKSAELMDRMYMASKSADMTLQDLGEAFKNVAPAAHTLGLNTQDVLVTLDALANKGIKASIAGTYLKNAFLRLADPTVNNTLKNMGVNIQDASGKMIPFVDIMRQYKQATAGMDNLQKASITKQLFGEQGAQAVLSMLQTTEQEIDNYTQKQKEANKAAQAGANIKMDSLQAQLEITKNKTVNLGEAFGSIMAPDLKDFNKHLQNAIDYLNHLSPGTKHLISSFTKFGLVLSLTSMGATFFTGKFIKLVNTAEKFNNSVAKAGGVSNLFKKSMDSAGKSMKVLKQTGKNLKLDKVLNGMAKSARILGKIAFANPIKVFSKSLKFASGLVKNFKVGNIVKSISSMTGRFLKFGGSAFRSLMNVRKGLSILRLAFATNPIGIVLLVLAGIIMLVATHWDYFKSLVVAVWEKIKEKVQHAIDRIKPHLDKIMKSFEKMWKAVQDAWDKIVGFFTSGSDESSSILDILSSVITTVFGIIINTITTAITIASDIINTLIGVFTGIVTFLTGVFTGNWSQAWDGIVQVFSSIFGGIKDICKDIMDGIKGYINEVISGINSVHFKLPDFLGGWEFKGLSIPLLYTGSSNFEGGLATIHDQGGEIVDLPRGSRILPHDKSIQEAYNMGASQKVNNNNKTVNITIAKLAECIQVRDQQDIDEIANQLAYKLKVHGINQLEGAI